jgi:hypothetical protein
MAGHSSVATSSREEAPMFLFYSHVGIDERIRAFFPGPPLPLLAT